LFDLTRELGMEALFECHTREQIEAVPADAEIFGINSRTFASGRALYEAARKHRQAGGAEDLTIDPTQFDLVRHLPPGAIKVAESGVSPATVARLRDDLGYHAALVGTSLLLAPNGVQMELDAFAHALAAAEPKAAALARH
jgi:indole-3-glycerol phosphate synthase